MRKSEDLTDYTDNRRSPLLDAVEWIIPRVIAVSSILLILAVCGVIEAM